MIKIIYLFRIQCIIDKNYTESTTNNESVIEKYIEPEKLFTDSFNTECSDSDNLNFNRNVISHKVKQNKYTDQVSNFFKY